MDERRRELERRRAGGDAVAGAELLRLRQRAGEIDESRVRLAARLGDPAALILRPMLHVWGFSHLAGELRSPPWVVDVPLRAALAAGRVVARRLPLASPRSPSPFDPQQLPRRALDAVELWLRLPTSRSIDNVRRVLHESRRAIRDEPRAWVGEAWWYEALAELELQARDRRQAGGRLIPSSWTRPYSSPHSLHGPLAPGPQVDVHDALEESARRIGTPRVLAAVREHMSGFALGRDPFARCGGDACVVCRGRGFVDGRVARRELRRVRRTRMIPIPVEFERRPCRGGHGGR